MHQKKLSPGAAASTRARQVLSAGAEQDLVNPLLRLKPDEELVRTAWRHAKELVAADRHRQWLSFFVIDDRVPPPFPTTWRRKNISGISMRQRDAAVMELWIATALLCGYPVCRSFRARGTSGTCRILSW